MALGTLDPCSQAGQGLGAVDAAILPSTSPIHSLSSSLFVSLPFRFLLVSWIVLVLVPSVVSHGYISSQFFSSRPCRLHMCTRNAPEKDIVGTNHYVNSISCLFRLYYTHFSSYLYCSTDLLTTYTLEDIISALLFQLNEKSTHNDNTNVQVEFTLMVPLVGLFL